MRMLIWTGLLLGLTGCSAPSTDDWLGQLKDSDVAKRREAIRALAARGAEPDAIIPALVEAVRDENGYVRRDALLALAKFGADASDALPAVTAALKDEAQRVRVAAVATLKKIDPRASPQSGAR